VLGDEQLGQALVRAVGVVQLVAVQEEDDIGVLLEGAALAQVGQHRPLVRTRLQVAAELGQRHHGHLELTGQDLESPRDLGHLDLAVLGVGPAAHELEVVDHDQAEVAYA
jgi:hypothetical protein